MPFLDGSNLNAHLRRLDCPYKEGLMAKEHKHEKMKKKKKKEKKKEK